MIAKAIMAFVWRFGLYIRCPWDCPGTCQRTRWDEVERAQEYTCRRCSMRHVRYRGKPGTFAFFPGDIRATLCDEPPLWEDGPSTRSSIV